MKSSAFYDRRVRAPSKNLCECLPPAVEYRRLYYCTPSLKEKQLYSQAHKTPLSRGLMQIFVELAKTSTHSLYDSIFMLLFQVRFLLSASQKLEAIT